MDFVGCCYLAVFVCESVAVGFECDDVGVVDEPVDEGFHGYGVAKDLGPSPISEPHDVLIPWLM